MEEKTRERSGRSLKSFRDGRDSNNLAEFPLAVLTDYAPKGQKTLEFSDTMEDSKTGEVIERRVCITGSEKFGLPTAKDEDVLLALVQLTKLTNDFTNPEVYFTKHQVIDILRWPNRGWSYDRVEESLHRWKDVAIHYWNAWRDRPKGPWRDTEAVGVIEYFKFTDGRRHNEDAQSNRSRFIWNSVLFESLKSGFVKKLDFALYRSIEHPGAKRAYRFLDKRFYYKPRWGFDLRVFACEKVGLSRKYDTGQIKSKLTPMMKELVDLGVIEPISYVKKAPKQWQIEVEQSKQSQKRSQAKNPEHQLISELMNRGVHEPSAKRLVEEFDKSQIERNLAVFDSLMKQQPSQRPKKPPGFLTWAIRVDYASQHKMEMGRLETKRQRGRGQPVPKASGRVAVDQSGERREPDSKRAAIASYLSGLSDDERMQLEAEALRQAGPMVADGYDRSKKAGNQKAFEDYRQLILEKHLVELLGLN